MVGTDQVMSLSAGQEEADRIAERIGQRMDFSAGVSGISCVAGRAFTDLRQGDLAAFLIQLLEAVKAVPAVPHDLASLTDVAELLGQLAGRQLLDRLAIQVTAPCLGASSLASPRSSVDLPQPLGPTSAVILPLGIDSDRF